MKNFLTPVAALAVMLAPAALSGMALSGTAHAADPCRNMKGQFAKCGTPGAMTADQYKAMKAKGKPMPMMSGKPMPMMSGKPVAKPTPAPAKKGPCKDAKGKFAKCK